jgi:hypothetical protein
MPQAARRLGRSRYAFERKRLEDRFFALALEPSNKSIYFRSILALLAPFKEFWDMLLLLILALLAPFKEFWDMLLLPLICSRFCGILMSGHAPASENIRKIHRAEPQVYCRARGRKQHIPKSLTYSCTARRISCSLRNFGICAICN